MRDATASMKAGMLDNPGSDLGTDLLDQQLAVSMSGQPGGLSSLIEQQLVRQMGVTDGTADGASLPALMSARPRSPASRRRCPPRPTSITSRSTPKHPRYQTKRCRLSISNARLPKPKPTLSASTPTWRAASNVPPAFRRASCSARPATKRAGASTKSRAKAARRRTTCLASRPAAVGLAKSQK